MRFYPFAKVIARDFPTEMDLNNPYIYKDVCHIINVSEKEHPSVITSVLKQRGITSVHIPLKEEIDGMSASDICRIVELLLLYDKANEKTVVHCDCGQNRSHTVIEAFYYAKNKKHFEDSYKGYLNHLICNCKRNFITCDLKDTDRLQYLEELLSTIKQPAY